MTDIDMLAGDALRLAVAEALGWQLPGRDGVQLWIARNPAGKVDFVPDWTQKLTAAWELTEPGWYWEFFEGSGRLQVTLYTSLALWRARPGDFDFYPAGVIVVNVRVTASGAAGHS